MDKQTFLQSVTNCIRTKEAKILVEKELNSHLQKSEQDWKSKGLTESEAEQKAVAEMGNPVTLGKKFHAMYKPKFDWITASVFIVVLLVGSIPLFLLQEVVTYISISSKVTSLGIGIFIAAFIMFSTYQKWVKYRFPLYIGSTSFLIVAFIFQYFELYGGIFQYRDARIHLGGSGIDLSITIPFLLVAFAGLLAKPLSKHWTLIVLLSVPNLLLLTLIDYATALAFVLMTITMLAFNQHKKTAVAISYIFGVILVPSLFFRFGTLWWGGSIIPGTSWIPKMVPLKYDLYISHGMAIHTTMVGRLLMYSLGYFLTGLLLVSLVYFLLKAISLVKVIQNKMGQQLLIGSAVLFGFQLFYNVGMNVGVLPFMSVPLPFLSYGLLPILLNAIFIGIILSTYRTKNIQMSTTNKIG